MREPDVVGGHPAKIVDEVGGLFFVPPADRLDLDANFLQGGEGAAAPGFAGRRGRGTKGSGQLMRIFIRQTRTAVASGLGSGGA